MVWITNIGRKFFLHRGRLWRVGAGNTRASTTVAIMEGRLLIVDAVIDANERQREAIQDRRLVGDLSETIWSPGSLTETIGRDA